MSNYKSKVLTIYTWEGQAQGSQKTMLSNNLHNSTKNLD